MLLTNKKCQKLKSLFKNEKVLSLEHITSLIGTTHRTAQRYLKKLDSLTSYTHRGKFCTLPEIAQFDENGLWYYSSIGFSKHGSSLATILALIKDSRNGITKDELEHILKIKIPRQMQILLEQDKLHRVKLGNKYLYLPKAIMADRTETLKIVATRQIEQYHKEKLTMSDIVAVLKAVLLASKIDMNDLARLINKYNLHLSVLKLEKLISSYDLTEKKRH